MWRLVVAFAALGVLCYALPAVWAFLLVVAVLAALPSIAGNGRRR